MVIMPSSHICIRFLDVITIEDLENYRRENNLNEAFIQVRFTTLLDVDVIFQRIHYPWAGSCAFSHKVFFFI